MDCGYCDKINYPLTSFFMFVLLISLLAISTPANTVSKETSIKCGDYNLPDSTCRKLENIIESTPHTKGHSHRLSELPEQVMTAHFLKENQSVLEIGSNTGRNTLTIAKILGGSGIFYTSESNKSDRLKTIKNLQSNKLFHPSVHVIPAISNSPLEQRGWYTRPRTLFGWLKRWEPVESEPLPAVKFDTIIADCEGCFLKMTDDYPELLENATTIIIENDWKSMRDYDKIHQRFHRYGFKSVYNHPGPEWVKGRGERIYSHFYEVLIKEQH